jgi:hypothetical protein
MPHACAPPGIPLLLGLSETEEDDWVEERWLQWHNLYELLEVGITND